MAEELIARLVIEAAAVLAAAALAQLLRWVATRLGPAPADGAAAVLGTVLRAL
jgi:hypothetical protein